MTATCRHCGSEFDPQKMSSSVEVQAGLILARERYHDEGQVCSDCLASRSRLAMMYDPSCHH